MDKCVLVFLDDILICSASMEEHVEHLRQVLNTLRRERLYAKASKCEMVQTSIEFLRQQISGDGMTPTKAKLKVVCDWSKSQNLHGIRSFLGFANYYCRFVRNFAEVANPLTDLTKKGMPWQWGPVTETCIPAVEGCTVHCTSVAIPKPGITLRGGNGCIRSSSRRSPDAR